MDTVDFIPEFPRKIANWINAYWNTRRYMVIAGGRGKGATFAFMLMSLVKSFELSRGRICLTREIKDTVDHSSKARLESLIYTYGIEMFFEVQNKTIINLKTGTDFIFNGLSTITADSFKGLENIDIVHIGEGHAIELQPWQKLKPTIRNAGSQIWVDYNPENISDPVHQYFTDNPNSWPFTGNSKLDLAYLFLTYKDNEFFTHELEQERKADMSSYTKEEYEWIWLGKLKDSRDRYIIPYTLIDTAMNRDTHKPDGLPVVGADIAHQGGDQITFYKRAGTIITNTFADRYASTTQTFENLKGFVDYDKTVLIIIDNGHVGASVADMLEDEGYYVMRVDFGSTSPKHKLFDPVHSYDVSTDMHRKALKWLSNGGVVPFDQELADQLSQRKWDFVKGEKAIIKVESKKDFAKHYTGESKSPDKADGFILSIYADNLYVDNEEIANYDIYE